jgi:hypothetical protein
VLHLCAERQRKAVDLAMGEQLLLIVLQCSPNLIDSTFVHAAGVCEADEVAEIALPALDARARPASSRD